MLNPSLRQGVSGGIKEFFGSISKIGGSRLRLYQIFKIFAYKENILENPGKGAKDVPADLSIDRIAPAAPSPVKADESPPQANTAQAEAVKSPSLPNPRLTVDPTLNRVVLEFFSSNGVLTNTLPSQRQLEAYRLAAFSAQNTEAASEAIE
jgi:hypothetical protein